MSELPVSRRWKHVGSVAVVVLVASCLAGVVGAAPAMASAAAAPSITFPGLGRSAFGVGFSPDLSGDVGPDVFVQAVEGGYAVFRKSDGAMLVSGTFASLFGSSPTGTVCDTANNSDPQVLYDTQSDRWIMGVMAWGDPVTGPYDECLAVSATGDPVAGGWSLYPVQIVAAGTHISVPDTPRLAVWLDAIYMSANVSNDLIGGLGIRAFAFNRTDLESGATLRWQSTTPDPSAERWNDDEANDVVPTGLRLQATSPAAGTNEYYVGNSGQSNNIDVWRYHVDWTVPSSSWFGTGASNTAPSQVGYATYESVPGDVTVPSPGNALDPQADDVTAISQYGKDAANGNLFLWTAITVDQGPAGSPTGRSALEWFKIRLNASNPAIQLGQSGVFAPDQASRWLPALAQDKTGDMAIGYNVTSSIGNSSAGNIYPSIRYAGHLSGQPSGVLEQTEQTLFTGTGYQCCNVDEGPPPVPNDLWGTETAMSLDPDGCTFWLSGEYYDTQPATLADDIWKTRIGAFRFSSCTPTLLTTVLSGQTGSGGFGNTATLSATLKASGTSSGVGGKTVSFTMNGSAAGTAVTNSSGVATLTGVSMSGLAVGATIPFTAAFSGSTAYGAATTVSSSFVVAKGSQAIAFSQPSDHLVNDADFTVAATASSGLTVSLAASGVCTVGGSTVHLTGAVGTCTLTASQAGNANYNAATSISRTFNVSLAPQSITFAAIANKTFGDPDFGVGATASSGLAVSLSPSGPCTVTGATAHITGAGSCTITAQQAGNATYAAAPNVVRTFTIAKANQTITFADPGAQTVGASFAVSATSSSGLAVSFTGDANCAVSGSMVTASSVGTCVVTAQQAGTANYNAVGTPRTIQIPNRGTQSITFADPGSQTVGTAFTASATASSGLGVTFLGDGNCVVSGAGVTGSHTPSCVVTAQQAGNANWNAATNVVRTITLGKGSQTISAFSSATAGSASGRTVGTSQSLSLTATSGLTLTYTSTTPAACVVGTSSVSFLAIGSCSIVANQAGNADWDAAAQVGPYTYAIINKGTQVLTFDPVGSQAVGASFGVNATSSVGLVPVTYVGRTPAVCSISGATVTTYGSGTCTIRAQQAGDANWNAASTNSGTDLNVSIVATTPQTITFGPLAGRTFGDADFSVSATASSGLPVSFTASGQCTVSGTAVHLTGAGTCTITASQGGNATYAPAPNVAQPFTIAKANQTVAFGAIPNRTFGDADFSISATASSGLAVTFTATGQCTVAPDGSVVHPTAAGSCSITARQGGDANWNDAPDVTQSFTIAKATQTISFAALANRFVDDADVTVSATASSSLAVTFSSSTSTVCTVSGTTVHMTGIAGTCTVAADQGGNANYNAAPTVSRSFTVSIRSQTITFGPLAGRTFGDADFSVSATASSGLPVSFTASGQCTVSGTAVHLTGAGTCTITASQGGNATYAPAPNVAQPFTIAKANQTVAFGAIPNRTFGDADFSISATASSGLAVTFTATGQCTVAPDGSVVHPTAAGSCSITARQSGDASWNAAPDVVQSFTIAAVTARSTTTTLTFSKATVVHGKKVKFTGKVKSGPVIPTGAVEFMVDGRSVGQATLALGKGFLTVVANMGVGAHSVVAIYHPDAGFLGSTSVAKTLTIT